MFAYAGSFDKISLQDESGGMQSNVYFDDVSLLGVNGQPDEIFKGNSSWPGLSSTSSRATKTLRLPMKILFFVFYNYSIHLFKA